MAKELIRRATSGDGGGYEKPPAGNHVARLVAMVEMGTQRVRDFETKEDKDQKQVYLVFELLTKKRAGTNQNHVIGAALNDSLNEKATLSKWLRSGFGAQIPPGGDYNLFAHLGEGCLVNVVHKGEKGYARVEGVSAMIEGMPLPAAQNEPVGFDLAELLAGAELPDWLPYLFGRPLMEHVRDGKEYRAKFGGAPAAGRSAEPAPAGKDDPIPF